MGKWFATTFEDAVRWGRKMQQFLNPRPFRIAAARLPRSILPQFVFYERHDTIGSSYFVPLDRLTILNQSAEVTVFIAVYEVEERP